MNGTLACPFGQGVADLSLNRGENQPVISVLRRRFYKLRNLHSGLQGFAAYKGCPLVAGQGHGDFQHVLFFAPVDGKDLMVLQSGNRGVKVIIKLVDRIGLHIFCLACEASPAHTQFPQAFAKVRIIRKILRNNITGTVNGLLGGGDAFLLIDKLLGKCLNILVVLGKNRLGQRLQPLFPGNGATGAAFLLIGPVQVLHFRHRGGTVNGSGQFRGEFSLIFDGFLYFVPTLLQISEIGKSGFQIPQCGVIHGTVEFLSVPGDKGNGVSLIQQSDNIFNIFLFLLQFLRKNFFNTWHFAAPFHMVSPFYHIFPKLQ